ncbi:hypothetical protein [Kitasatospora sp. NE20-6]|uniref:hypothetical protein n=1 Tax=Kitasatospora sp. NE20-6 TaxID=2859066 RepID=UPI0038B2E806
MAEPAAVTGRTVPLPGLGGPSLAAEEVTGAGTRRIGGRAIVVNTGARPAAVAEHPRKAIPPLGSAVLHDTAVEHTDRLLVLRTPESADAAALTREPGWHLLAGLLPGFPPETPLWRGPQHDLGTVELVPEALLGGPGGGRPRPYRLKVNLWFAPAGTDCRIHHRHAFLEVHTQVFGTGRMQKFRADDHGTLHEDVLLAPGNTHEPFCEIGADGGFVYPWHQYRADTDCVWLAVEYHEER